MIKASQFTTLSSPLAVQQTWATAVRKPLSGTTSPRWRMRRSLSRRTRRRPTWSASRSRSIVAHTTAVIFPLIRAVHDCIW